jgi:hypothetical protein
MICRFEFCRWQNLKRQEEKVSRLQRETQNNGFESIMFNMGLTKKIQNPFWFLRRRRKNFSPRLLKNAFGIF